MTPDQAAAIRAWTSANLLARAAYAASTASPADRKAASRARRRTYDQARYRARKKGTAA